jgi:hypothetical protein
MSAKKSHLIVRLNSVTVLQNPEKLLATGSISAPRSHLMNCSILYYVQKPENLWTTASISAPRSIL